MDNGVFSINRCEYTKGNYLVRLESFGWTGSRLFLYIKVPFLKYFTKYKLVWNEISSRPVRDIIVMKPKQLINHYEYVIEKYEDYQKAWKNFE